MRKHKEKLFIGVRNTRFSLLIITIYFLTFSSSVFAQGTSSPYSRYGIGDLNNKNTGQAISMGGTNIAMQNDSVPMFFINPSNPASNSNIRLTTAELGLSYTRVQLESATNKQTINNASIGYFSLGFPFKKWWGGSIGLIPLSSVGYKVTDQQTIDNIGTVNYLYQGSGGVNQIYFGNGIKPLYGLPNLFVKSKKYKALKDAKKDAEIAEILNRKKSWQNLSLGFNTSYLFGGISHIRRSIFPYGSGFFNTRTGTTTRVSDVYFDYGAQYAYTFSSVKYHDRKDTVNPIKHRELKDKVKLLVGATFSAQSKVNAKIDSLSYSYYNDAQGYERIRDTIENSQNYNGKIVLPLSFGVGVGFKKGDRWLVAADFAMQNWSSYQAFNQDGGLKNSYRVSLGAQWVPNAKALQKKYMARVHYRLGARYAQTALELKSTQLTEKALTAGFGFPVGRNYLLQNFSMINIGVEFGQRGTTENNLIKENFIRATVGFTINDRWFVKPKFD